MTRSIPPPPKPPPESAPPKASWIGIVLTILFCTAAYVVLSFLTLSVFGPVLIIAGVVFAVVAFHYVVWGWWLGRVIRAASEEENEVI